MSVMNKRGGVIYLALPKRPNAPKGTCRWCGQKLIGARVSVRRYCYTKYEGRDCVNQYKQSMVWNTRLALRRQAQLAGIIELRCVDCGFVVERLYPKASWPKERIKPWEADHDVPLWAGGAHTLANLRCRCTTCHAAKTTREAAQRSAAKPQAHARRKHGEGHR